MGEGTARLVVVSLKATAIEPVVLRVEVLQDPRQMSAGRIEKARFVQILSSFCQPAGKMRAIGGLDTAVKILAPCAVGVLQIAQPISRLPQRLDASGVAGLDRPGLQSVHDLRGVERRRFSAVLVNFAAGESALGELQA